MKNDQLDLDRIKFIALMQRWLQPIVKPISVNQKKLQASIESENKKKVLKLKLNNLNLPYPFMTTN